VRGNDGTWQYSGQGSGEGKQAHISSAYEELSSRFGTSTTATADPTSDNPSPQVTSVTRASTLLIDDDVKNIRAALKHSEFFLMTSYFLANLLSISPSSSSSSSSSSAVDSSWVTEFQSCYGKSKTCG